MPERLRINYNRGGSLTPHQRLILWCVGLSLLVSALAGLAAALYITTVVKDSVQKATEQQGAANCRDIANGRISGDQFRFAVREELGFIPGLISASEKQHHGHLSKATQVFLAQQIQGLNAALAVERKTIPGLPQHVSGYGDLFPLLADQPLIACPR